MAFLQLFLAKIGDLDPKVITTVISNMGLKRCLHKMYSLNIHTYFLTVLQFGSILQILSGLYIGNFRDSKDLKQLDLHKITHILSIHDDARKLFKVRNQHKYVYAQNVFCTQVHCTMAVLGNIHLKTIA